MGKELQHIPGAKYPIIKASFDLELAKNNYHALLQELSLVKVTKDNVNDDLTGSAKDIMNALTAKKDEESKEPLQLHRDIMEVYNGVYKPLKAEVDRINNEKKVVSLEIHRDQAQQLAEQQRINNAKAAIIEFTNRVANLISTAKTDDDVVQIEMLIGREKNRKNVYHEFINDLITQCDGLRPQIKDLKDNIRKLQAAELAEKEAIESNDLVKVTELREQKEHLAAVIQETGIRIHETAFEQATTIDIVVPEVVDTAPKGRSNWKWRVDDIKLLQKKMPHLVKTVPDEDAIDILLKTKKSDGSLDGKMEETLHGLTFFNDKSFVR